MAHQIYALYGPREGEERIRYVGYTSKTLENRINEHCFESAKIANSHRTKWVRSLLRANVRPAGMCLEHVTETNWKEREQFWIKTLRERGFNLVNSTDGGEGLINPTDEVRGRISQSVRATGKSKGNQHRKGKPHSEADRKKISDGIRSSEKHREAMLKQRGINRHAHLTPEQIVSRNKKISESKRGSKYAPFSEEVRRRMSESHKGLKHKPETIEKIRQRNLGNQNAVGMKMPEHAVESIREFRKGGKIITDGTARKFLKAGDVLPEGWRFVNNQTKER